MSGVMPAGPLAYTGNPLLYINKTFDPTPDNNKFTVPTLWTNTETSTAFLLVSNEIGDAYWLPLGLSASAGVQTITGNAGIVNPSAGNVNIVGSNITGINTNGALDTLTISALASSTTQEGTIALASDAEVLLGADSSKAVVSSSLANKLGAQTLHGIALGDGPTSSMQWTIEPSDGQILIGRTGNFPDLATITAGSGITVTNGPGSITLSSTGGGVTWNNIVGLTANMMPNQGYQANNAATVTLNLPVSSNFGDIIQIVGFGLGGWTIGQQPGQQIFAGFTSSTVGVGGSVSSTHYNDTVTLFCNVANTTWSIIGGRGAPSFV
jgi:hypothetical protein